jgi:hypothetical protein
MYSDTILAFSIKDFDLLACLKVGKATFVAYLTAHLGIERRLT